MIEDLFIMVKFYGIGIFCVFELIKILLGYNEVFKKSCLNVLFFILILFELYNV